MATSWLIGAPHLTPAARSKWTHFTLQVPSQQPLARVFGTVTRALDLKGAGVNRGRTPWMGASANCRFGAGVDRADSRLTPDQ